MTDQELIKRRRDGCNLQQRDGERAADRIEALTKERDEADRIEELVEERDTARRLLGAATQMQTETQAKLEKAVETLETIVDNGGAGSYHLARTTLAELEGK